MRIAILTVSDKSSRGEREDLGGPAIRDALAQMEAEWGEYRVVADEQDEIAAALTELCAQADLVLTTGGTGLAPRDVTPQATRRVLDYEVPGIAEAMRAESMRVTPMG